jgi:TRAP-type mannitol/chloroaromatic compound transport system substrate-binding protein
MKRTKTAGAAAQRGSDNSRRNFLKTAALGATGAAVAALPTIHVAQAPISMRWQSTWPTKDIFHEYALDYA